MDFVLLSPVKKVVGKHDVLSVSFNGVTGKFSVFPHHAEMISILKKGYVFFNMGDCCMNFVEIETDGAVVHVKDDVVRVFF